jgi:uncharacterized damage-inducible protein DinB
MGNLEALIEKNGMPMEEMNRQKYESMLNIIENAELSVASIGRVISSLKRLLAPLWQPDPQWVERFRTELGDLEQVYAYNLMYPKESLSEQELKWLTDALQNLKLMVRAEIDGTTEHGPL